VGGFFGGVIGVGSGWGSCGKGFFLEGALLRGGLGFSLLSFCLSSFSFFFPERAHSAGAWRWEAADND